jgi:5'-3' exoribonuclease 1
MHINEGALGLMFRKYKEALPRMGGYINEGGSINLQRLGTLLEELGESEFRFFEAEYSDEKWIRSKSQGVETVELQKTPKSFTITPSQKQILKDVKQYVLNRPSSAQHAKPFDLPPSLPARDRKFVEQLADDLRLMWTTITDDHGDRFIRLQLPGSSSSDENGENEEEEEEEDEEASMALRRVIKKYDNAKVHELTAEEAQTAAEQKYDAKFKEWKDKYYKDKFGFGLDNEAEMKKLAENYVQGLQWVLYYYYRGVVSWPWFFQYHYAPMISDVKLGVGADIDFKLGQPFRPFQQLMGVLPDRSKKIVPTAYWDLMTSPESPIIDFYPRDFELDMNGKKMEWEAVVKIPFIEEHRLLTAMASKEHLLTPDEKARNDFGVSLKFTYSPSIEFVYPSSLPGVFPDIPHCHCIENIFDLPTVEGLEPWARLVDGVKLGASALAGFPSLKTLPNAGQLAFHGVNVFQQESRKESMVITLLDPESRSNIELAKQKLGQRVHVGYPFLQEGLVVRVSDELFDYVLPKGEQHVVSIPHSPFQIEQWARKSDKIESYYSKRLGMIVGSVDAIVHIDLLKGLNKNDDGATVKEFGEIPGQETDYALQLIVDQVISEDERFIEREALPIEEEFPEGSRGFFLGEFNYGRAVQVIGHENGKVNGVLAAVKGKEPEFGKRHAREAEKLSPYTPSFAIARNLRLNPLVLAKITSSFSVTIDGQRVNLGLNLKFEAKKLKVLGYSRRGDSGWEFSLKAVELIQQYMINFPDFIAGIQRNPQGDKYEPTDFYPEDIAMAKIKDIKNWLKSIEAKHFEKVPLDAEQLDSDVVKLIEVDADRLVQTQSQPEIKRLKSVPRQGLLKPADVEHRLGNQRFSLGDRVVYAQDSGKVPIATRGTVVGLTRTPRTVLLDVVFDVSFMSGTSLGDRCSPFRGQTVPVHSVLNLTDRQLIAGTRAATNQQAQIVSQNVGYGAPLGPGGQGQLKEAHAPAPLRGSYRGAIAGQQNAYTSRGGRGGTNGASTNLPFRPHPTTDGYANGNNFRGGRGRGRGTRGQAHATRGGYTALENGNPEEGVVNHNPNFRPQSFNRVPPPASLNNGGGGRGHPNGDRGRGSRGNPSRGRGGADRGKKRG